MQILVKFPTRNRPQRFKACLDTWLGKLSGKHEVLFVVNQEPDDASRLEVYGAYRVAGPGIYDFQAGLGTAKVEFIEIATRNKIEAINCGIGERKFDILISAADDMWPVADGYDDIMVHHMEEYFPELDGSLGYGIYKIPLPGQPYYMLSVMGYKLYRYFGYIYYPGYISVKADREFSFVANRLGKLISIPGWQRGEKLLIEHRHPAHTGEPYDPLLKAMEDPAVYAIDQATFNWRQGINFELPDSRIYIADESRLVSALMPTRDRPQFMQRAIHNFLKQSYRNSELVILDNGKESIQGLLPQHPRIHYVRTSSEIIHGEQRNLALKHAQGEIIVQMDDDDWYGRRYIEHQVRDLLTSGKSVVGYHTFYYYSIEHAVAWQHTCGVIPYATGANQCYWRNYGAIHPFPSTKLKSDAIFAQRAVDQGKIASRAAGADFVTCMHNGNQSVYNLTKNADSSVTYYNNEFCIKSPTCALTDLPREFFEESGYPIPVYNSGSKKKRVNIISIHNGVGLEIEYTLLGNWLRWCGCEVMEIDRRKPQAIRAADVNLFDEGLAVELCRFASRNVLLVHPEWFLPQWDNHLLQMDAVACKTRDAVRIMGALTDHAVYTGFWSRDMMRPEIERRDEWFHLAGGAVQKNKEAVLRAWQQMENPPMLYVAGNQQSEKIKNVKFLGRLSDNDLAEWMNRCRFHIIPSAYEGFGHAIWEAMSCAAVVITLDMPPMSDIVDPETPTVEPLRFRRMGKAVAGFTSAEAIIGAVQCTLALGEARWGSIGRRNRAKFIRDGFSARSRMSEVLGLVGMDRSPPEILIGKLLARHLAPCITHPITKANAAPAPETIESLQAQIDQARLIAHPDARLKAVHALQLRQNELRSQQNPANPYLTTKGTT